MALVNLTGIQPTQYTELASDTSPAEGEVVLVPFDRLAEESEAFFQTVGRVGVLVGTETTFSALEPFANKISFVAIDFPAFGDGRGFSLAVRLRKDYGFKGEIRAVGNIIPDQAQFLMRAGFDSVEATEERKTAFETALKRFPSYYQTDAIGLGQRSVAHVRHSAKNDDNTDAADTAKEGQRKAS
ncbi:DUF934 domain-containing protein [Kordiimonas aquimaris]|uniref:DUF934 domain-containing protein n=1 Tax=Kordiimonas aquimaris TaxID=707591 RepID=UPI0021CE706D|nr:DUF934 domain-containing protein [Kordiimonas aquimaris]